MWETERRKEEFMGSKDTVEFRKEAIALVRQGGSGVARVAGSLGVSGSSLCR